MDTEESGVPILTNVYSNDNDIPISIKRPSRRATYKPFFKDLTARQTSAAAHEEHRAASPMELFFDLIMAASFAKLGEAIAEDGNSNWGCFYYYLVCFYIIYQNWLNVLTFTNRFANEGAFDGIFLLWNITSIACLNLHISEAIENDVHNISGFALFSAVARISNAFGYATVMKTNWGCTSKSEETSFDFARNHFCFQLIQMTILLNAAFSHGDRSKTWDMALLLLSALFDISYNVLLKLVKIPFLKEAFIPVHCTLVSERVGLIFIISLGEIVVTSVLKNLEPETSVNMELVSALNVLAGASTAFIFNLMYFKLYNYPGEHALKHAINNGWQRGMGFVNLNCFICMSSSLVGAVLRRSTDEKYQDSDRLMLAGCFMVFIACLSFGEHFHKKAKYVEYGYIADITAILIIPCWYYFSLKSEWWHKIEEHDYSFPNLIMYLIFTLILCFFRRFVLGKFYRNDENSREGKEDAHSQNKTIGYQQVSQINPSIQDSVISTRYGGINAIINEEDSQ